LSSLADAYNHYRRKYSKHSGLMIRAITYFLYFTIAVLLINLLDREGHLISLRIKNFHEEFYYPVDGDVTRLKDSLMGGHKPWLPPVFHHKYKIVINPKHRCNANNTNLVYLVQSYAENEQNRQMIRHTWGNELRYSGIKLFFFMGLSESDIHAQKQVKKEYIIFQDIVQGDFKDTDRSMKFAMTSKWASTNCQSATAFVIADDSTYLSTENLLAKITDKKYSDVNPSSHVAFTTQYRKDHPYWSGHVYKNVVPVRKRYLERYVKLEEYEYDEYPPIVYPVSLMSRTTLLDFYYGSYFTAYLSVPEAWMALIAFKLNMKPQHDERFIQSYPNNPDDLKNVLSVSGITYKSIYELWKKEHDRKKFEIK